jgi:hypothetical protein
MHSEIDTTPLPPAQVPSAISKRPNPTAVLRHVGYPIEPLGSRARHLSRGEGCKC